MQPYSAFPARLANFIGGEYRPPRGGGYLENIEPATGRVLGEVPDSDGADVDGAVVAAKAAFPGWSTTPAAERSRILMRLAELIERDTERLAQAESADSGKPVSLARTLDIPRSAVNFRFFAGAILHAQSEMHETDGQTLNYTLRRPRGVAGVISPWNLPLYLLTWKIAPALAAGNTCVAKPSEVTPLTAHLLCELAHEAGVPAGVLNVVQGTGAKAGAAIVTHADVSAVSFTGSTPVGRWIAGECAKSFKRVSLELGGKNPYIVFADADVDAAIETAVRAGFSNQGQICLCGSRMLVEKSVYARFVAGLVERAKALRIGDPLEEATQHGASSSAGHVEKIDGYVRLARELGGKVECGGNRVAAERLPERCRGGFFYEPTVITGLGADCLVEQEEIFGPVVSVSAFESEAEAVERANNTPYGLAASVWTRDLSRAHRVAGQIDAGVVWVNCWMVRDLRTPFGGMKQSGVGREGGWEALKFFTEPKNVCVRY